MEPNSEDNLAGKISQWEEKGRSTFWGLVGCEFVAFEGREVVVSLLIEPRHLNLLGIVHGGVHATLIDSAMGLAVMRDGPEESSVTTNLNLHYVAPIREGRVTVRAEIVQRTRKSVHTIAHVRGEDGELLAFGTGSFRIVERKPGTGAAP
ncbi:PaaI family thioesterase [Cohnella fermenti]|uniref:PaaI family thioesterase n=1 Tax=Cohnella fermenti TaxID=2565925 RepID=A0A4S4BWQ7_9BACL|nr:PaaI family thioesterase [Cohnella fermenti]THF77522.1 PaaI family thioesterase [Cohnella fermenti]